MVGEDGWIKLIDFGLSTLNYSKSTKMSEIVGTPYYVAPEVLWGNYSSKCDMWSLGVLFYILLSGYLPFNGEKAEDVYTKVLSGKYKTDQKEWKKVSELAKDLLYHLLDTNYWTWYDAISALNHLWFK